MLRARRFALVAVLLGLGGGALSAFSAATAAHTIQHSYLTKKKNRVEVPSHYEPLEFAEFLALPALPEEYTVPDWKIVAAYTRQPVSLDGYLAEVLPVPDGATYGRPPANGDVHLHLRAARPSQCFPVGPRADQVVVEVTPHFQPPARGWSFGALLSLCLRQARVRISGWLLHDYEHVHAQPSLGKDGLE
ncbi:MAG: hypothetical protein HY725_08335 [Candidatus Rokubacteria bacterium]|nr:hypothetical protein [Candidatus Rokubacteria bacterium]